jgi:putative ATP-dependent endonuclease of OLD family
MRLTRVFIESFRGIRRLKLKLDPITVVIGENNHGKTSIFDALCLCLGRPGSDGSGQFREADFHVGADPEPHRPIRISLTFEDNEDGPLPSGSPLHAALTTDHDGIGRLRVEFWGHPDDRRITHRFVDQEGKVLDPQPEDSTLHELRRMHPVLLLRFAQRAPPQALDTEQPARETRAEERGRRELEAEVARVYHELADTRGPIPREDLRRGLAAARELYAGIKKRSPGKLPPLNGMLDRLVPAPAGDPIDTDRQRAFHQTGSGSHTLGLLMVLGSMLDVRGDEVLPEGGDPIIAIEEPEVHLHPILLASTWDVIEGLGAQTLVTTNSGELLSSVPLRFVRRLSRRDGQITVNQLHSGGLSTTELRRVGYHIRAKRGGVLFARCWLLVEGESEFWLLRQLANVLGYDLEAEGIRCVEFAQCGISPLVKLANDLGIEWHLLTDGDNSGAVYEHDTRRYLNGLTLSDRVTRLKRRDIERCLWYHGYQGVYLEAAGIPDREARERRMPPGKVIAKAVRKFSKPHLALTVGEACAARGPEGVPPMLKTAIEAAVGLARQSMNDPTAS